MALHDLAACLKLWGCSDARYRAKLRALAFLPWAADKTPRRR